MTTPDFTAFVENYALLINKIAADSRLDIDDVRHFSFELICCAIEKGKGIGWVIRSLQRTCRHAGQSSGFVNLNDCDQVLDSAEPIGLSPEDTLLMVESHELRQRQLRMLGSDCELILNAFADGTDEFGILLGITRRRAQQILENLATAIKAAKSNDEMISALSQLADRIRKASLVPPLTHQATSAEKGDSW